MIYLDGCYIAKFYLAEPDSAAVISRIMAEGAVGSALHAQVEVLSAFHRKMREGIMTGPEFQLLDGQEDVIAAILSGQDTIMVMPTGTNPAHATVPTL